MIEQLRTIRAGVAEFAEGDGQKGLGMILGAAAQLEAMVGEQQPVAWTPTLTYPHYEDTRFWVNGKPRQEDIDYWSQHGAGITYAYAAPVAQQPRPDFTDEWTGYLKDGETPFERFMRERKDLGALTKLYQRALEENERLKAQQPQAEPTDSMGIPLSCGKPLCSPGDHHPLCKLHKKPQADDDYKGWYCAHCQRGVDGSEVTFHEQHTVCGRVITDDLPPKQPQAEAVPKLQVLYRSMRESCGRTNWTASLFVKGRGDFTIARSEYPHRVRYEADRVRWLIGELDTEPFILDYDADEQTPCHLCGGTGELDGKPCWGLNFKGTVHHAAPQQAEAVQYTRADLDRAYSAGLVEGERLAIQQAEAVPPDVVRDAERYRWLRSGKYPYRFAHNVLNDTPLGIDAAIDAAIAQQKGGV